MERDNPNVEPVTISQLREAIQAISAEIPPVLDSWSSEGAAGCIDFARQLQRALENKGIRVVEQQGGGHISLTDDMSRRDDGKLIVDPSYSQFLHFDRKTMPPILVGSIGEIKTFFQKHRGEGTSSLNEDPDKFVDALYSATEQPKYTKEMEQKLMNKYG